MYADVSELSIGYLLRQWYVSVHILAHFLEECFAHFPLHVPLHFFLRSCLHEPRTDAARSVVHQQLMVRKWGWVGVSLLGWPSFLRPSFDLRSQCFYPTRCFDVCVRFWCARLFLWRWRACDGLILCFEEFCRLSYNRPSYRTSSRIVTCQRWWFDLI